VHSPVEGSFRCGGQGDAADDGQQREDDGQGGLVSENERGEQNREEGLHGLDGVREGHCHLAQAHVGERVAQRVHQGQRQDGQDLQTN